MHVSIRVYHIDLSINNLNWVCSLTDSRPADKFLSFNVLCWEACLVFICLQMLLICPFWEWDGLVGSAQQQRAFCSWCHCSCFDWQGADCEAPPPGSLRHTESEQRIFFMVFITFSGNSGPQGLHNISVMANGYLTCYIDAILPAAGLYHLSMLTICKATNIREE